MSKEEPIDMKQIEQARKDFAEGKFVTLDKSEILSIVIRAARSAKTLHTVPSVYGSDLEERFIDADIFIKALEKEMEGGE